MKRIVFALMLTRGAVALGGPINVGDIAPGAKWVVHFNAGALIASQIGQHLLNLGKENQLDQKLQDFVSKFGFDPTKDLAGVTLYGTGFDAASSVAIFRGKFDKQKLLDLVNKNEGHEEIAYGGYAIHRWVQPPPQHFHREGAQFGNWKDDGVRFGTFHDDGTVVISCSEETLRAALDVLDGKVQGQADIVPAASPGANFLAAGRGFPVPTQPNRHAQMLRRISAGLIQAGETQGNSFLSIALTARTAEDATRMRQMLNGLLAFASMAAEGASDSDRPALPWAPLIEGIQIGGSGESVELNVTVKTQTLIEAAEAARQMHRAFGGRGHWRQKPAE